MLYNPWVQLLNNWAHDVGSGLWAACLLVLWVLRSKIEVFLDGPESAWGAMVDVTWLMFWLLVGALVVITLTGIPRLLYWRRETPPEIMPAKRPALIGKHIAFLVIYGGGTIWAYTLIWPA